MSGKKIVTSILLAAVLLTVVIVPMSTQQGGSTYDPWLDYNEDGVIDVNDLHPLGGAYGTTGDPTKNVNVTNWPVARELFPENLKLRGYYYWVSGYSRRDLWDATTMRPPFMAVSDSSDPTLLDTTQKLILNRTYTQQKTPTNAYQILGLPLVFLKSNVTTQQSGVFFLAVSVRLGKVSMSGAWTELVAFDASSGSMTGGPFTDYQNQYFLGSAPVNTMINADERLGIRVLVYGRTASGTISVTVELLASKEDDFLADIPIVQNP
jgi:hypothetical protein